LLLTEIKFIQLSFSEHKLLTYTETRKLLFLFNLIQGRSQPGEAKPPYLKNNSPSDEIRPLTLKLRLEKERY